MISYDSDLVTSVYQSLVQANINTKVEVDIYIKYYKIIFYLE